MTTEIAPKETTKKRDKGFTLVELLIVIAILGVLATITVLSVRGISNNSKASTCASDKKVYDVAYEAYAASYSTSAVVVSPSAAPSGATWTPGATPELTLRAAGLLKDVSNNVDLSSTGVVSNQTGGNC